MGLSRLQARQVVVIVVLTIGALSVPKYVARRWVLNQQSSDVQQVAGTAFLNTFGR